MTEKTPTARRVVEVLLRGFAAAGLGASVLLLIEYLSPAPRFCGEGGGCDAVRLSKYAHILGVPTPVFGVAFFLAAAALTWMPASRLRRFLPVVAGAGAVFAAGLVWVQAQVVHAFCPYCMIVDVSAILLFALSIAAHPRPLAAMGGGWVAGSAVVALLAAGVPFGYGFAHRPKPPGAGARPGYLVKDTPDGQMPPLPEPIAREQRPGVATVVEFSDFECPYCRRQHGVLAEVIRSYGDRVRVVRKHALFVRSHRWREAAARAHCCAEEVGKGEAMADALFRAKDLRPEACEKVAEELDIDLAGFRACVGSQRVTDRLTKDTQDIQDMGVRGLPQLWIGSEVFEGQTLDPDVLRASIDRALKLAQQPAAPPAATPAPRVGG